MGKRVGTLLPMAPRFDGVWNCQLSDHLQVGATCPSDPVFT